jgi:hypothetical protein
MVAEGKACPDEEPRLIARLTIIVLYHADDRHHRDRHHYAVSPLNVTNATTMEKERASSSGIVGGNARCCSDTADRDRRATDAGLEMAGYSAIDQKNVAFHRMIPQ